MNRRNFLQGILAAGVAPAIVKAGNIMRIKSIILPEDEEFSAIVDPLFRGELDNISPFAARLWSAALFRELKKDNLVRKLIEA